jgi:DNA repair protein RecO (recombination protein O)
LYGGYYVAELLCGLTEEYDPHPTLYDEAIHTLRYLAEEDNAAIAILRFEFVTLREIGQLPTLDACLACGQTVGDRESVAFWVTQSGLLCRRCQKQEYQQFNIQAGTVAIMRRLASDSRSASRNLVASKQQTKEMRRFTTSAISSILGRRPKMLRYLQT